MDREEAQFITELYVLLTPQTVGRLLHHPSMVPNLFLRWNALLADTDPRKFTPAELERLTTPR